MTTTAADLVQAAKSKIVEIDCASARDQLGSETVFIDVREPPEWENGTVEGALRIPRGVLEWRVEDEAKLTNKQVPVVVYCKSGGRSALAAQTLQLLGYEDVRSMAGGYDAYSDSTN